MHASSSARGSASATSSSSHRPRAPTASRASAQEPEPPPALDPRVEIPLRRWPAIIALLAIPVLALAGVFGLREGTAAAESSAARLSVRHAQLTRYRMSVELQIEVRNLTARAIERTEVRIAREYLDRFTRLSLTPEPESIADDYVVALPQLEAGGATIVSVELEPEKAGPAAGEVSVRFDGREVGRVNFSTLVFP